MNDTLNFAKNSRFFAKIGKPNPEEFIVIGIEPPSRDSQPYRILARLADDIEMKEIYIFYSIDKNIENFKFIRIYGEKN